MQWVLRSGSHYSIWQHPLTSWTVLQHLDIPFGFSYFTQNHCSWGTFHIFQIRKLWLSLFVSVLALQDCKVNGGRHHSERLASSQVENVVRHCTPVTIADTNLLRDSNRGGYWVPFLMVLAAEWTRTGCCYSGRSPTSVTTLQLSLPSPYRLCSSSWAGKMSTDGYWNAWAWHLSFHLYEVSPFEHGGFQPAWHFTGWLCTPKVHVSKRKWAVPLKSICHFFPYLSEACQSARPYLRERELNFTSEKNEIKSSRKWMGLGLIILT